MALLAAHLNDAEIVVVNAEKILFREPGFALLDDKQTITGAEAYGSARLHPRRVHNRFWSQLHTDALPDQRFHHLSPADLVSRQLEQVWQRVSKPGDRLAVAVPAYMTNEHLGLFLGIAMELNIPIVACVDAAIAATRRQIKHAVPVHIDLSLHNAMLTKLLQNKRVQVERFAVIEDSGILALYDAWLRVISDAFVQQSRFDPLHTAETEQMLQDRLPKWLAAASTNDSVAMQVEYQGITHHVELESLELIGAASPVYQGIVSQLRALYGAEDFPALQLSDRTARMPGLADTLRSRVGGELFLLEPGATARGLVNRCPEKSGGDITLVRHLPWDQGAVDVERHATDSSGGQPTHLLFGHNAFSLHGESLVLGSQAVEGERWLDLQQDMRGVSRRHCVVSADNGQFVVKDLSRYGTYLNGHRIDGSAVLQVGDLIRIGTPGFELRLIAAEDSRGT